MKIYRFYLLSFLGLGIIIWSLNSGCTSKKVANPIPPTFSQVSKILVSNCAKCHGDSAIASHYGGGKVFDFSNYTKVADINNPSAYIQPGDYDTTAASGTPYDITIFGGSIMTDIEGVSKHPMPLGGPKLNDYERDAIRNWLFNKAPNN